MTNNHTEQLNTEEWEKEFWNMCDEFYFGSNSDLKIKAHPTKVLQFIKSLISKAITNERARIIKLIKHKGLHLGYANDIINQINKVSNQINDTSDV